MTPSGFSCVAQRVGVSSPWSRRLLPVDRRRRVCGRRIGNSGVFCVADCCLLTIWSVDLVSGSVTVCGPCVRECHRLWTLCQGVSPSVDPVSGVSPSVDPVSGSVTVCGPCVRKCHRLWTLCQGVSPSVDPVSGSVTVCGPCVSECHHLWTLCQGVSPSVDSVSGSVTVCGPCVRECRHMCRLLSPGVRCDRVARVPVSGGQWTWCARHRRS